ncbi:MAG: hypothetical protein IJY57_04960 [Clostridia bacterium]|nr:hypothetical protein [Clostridia bacterium]
MNFLGIDIGTTCCKCQLFSETGEILYYEAKDCPLKKDGAYSYVDIGYIISTIKELIKNVAKNFTVTSIAISSLGEAFVLLDENDEVISYPMLYTDPRGDLEAKEMGEKFGCDNLYKLTGVMPNAMFSISKLLWIKNNEPEKLKKAVKLFLVGEYVGYVLSGKRVIDYSLASRTGVLDVKNKVFAKELITELGIDYSLFSTPMEAGTIVGEIKDDIASELGLNKDCVLVLGSHDQVCTTIGAGALEDGESCDGMGTVSCVTTVFKDFPENVEMGHCGYPIAPFVDGLYCTYILSYANGSLVNWFRKDILHDYTGEENNFFSYAEKRFSEKPTDLLILPYFGGASTPFQDPNAKGAILGLTLNTTDAEIYQAILESTSLEVKLNLDTVKKFGVNVKSAVATGGGSNSKRWLQIKADITGLKLSTLRSSEGGLCGTAIIQAKAMGLVKTFKEGAKIFVKIKDEISPNPEKTKLYENKINQYKKLYKTIKEIY